MSEIHDMALAWKDYPATTGASQAARHLAYAYLDLEAKLETITQALYDVAHGMVPASFSLEGEPLEVRSRLFTWSQERARVGLATAHKGEEE